MRKFITFLLVFSLTLGLAETAEAQFWKKKSKKQQSKGKNKKGAKEKVAPKTDDDTITNEEDDRKEVSEPKKTRSQKKKEKQEKKRKEKEARKQQKAKEKKEKKDRKEQKRLKSKQAVAAPEQAKVVNKWAEIEYPVSHKKSHYRIDLLAPMYLDELVKNGNPSTYIPEKAIKGLDFYKGVQIAADTLKKALFDIDIYVHDVASLMESSEMLIRKNALDSADLLLGAVADKDVATLAAYAKRKQINFISAIAAADGGVKDNPYFTMLQPSAKSYCEWITTKLENTFPKGKVLLLHRNANAADENCFKHLTTDPTSKAMYNTLLCNTAPTNDAIGRIIDTQSNIVVLAINDVKYADSMLKILSREFPRTHFDVYGMQNWNSATTLFKQTGFEKFTFHIPTPFLFDNSSDIAKYVERVFKKEYGGKPTEMVYRGFETMYWYATMLKNYGTIFNKYYTDNELAPLTKFEIKPQWDEQGNLIYQENRHLSLKKIDMAKAVILTK